MTHWKRSLEHLIRHFPESKLQKLLLAPLGLLSFFYGWILRLRIFLYRAGIYQTHSLPCPVISVGNITLGGTGKTPLVALLAEWICRSGYRAVILCRGYKGTYGGDHGVVSDGENLLLGPEEAGDEPFLLAQKLRGIPVLVGRKRWIAGEAALDRFRPDVVILDDGFQHLSLKRDMNLLLLDASHPFDNGRLFPRGGLREPINQIKRADALILTKTGSGANMRNLNAKLLGWGVRIPVLRTDYQARAIRMAGREEALDLKILSGRKVLGFCGIAQPESFGKMLSDLKARVAALEIFPDHYSYLRRDLDRLRDRAVQLGAEALVTTEKDLVRLEQYESGPIPLWALSVDHVFCEGDQADLEALLRARLNLKLELPR